MPDNFGKDLYKYSLSFDEKMKIDQLKFSKYYQVPVKYLHSK